MAETEVTSGPGVFVGIDSGGTRTNVQIETNEVGSPSRLASLEVADSLSGALASELIPTVIQRIAAALSARLDELESGSLPVYAWISAAGFSPWTRDYYVRGLENLSDDLAAANVRAIGIGNDAVSLLLGSRADGIVISGTGSSTLVRSRSGDLYQVGGRDWVASDYGSGFWIGLEAIRQAYRDYEAGEDSVILQRFRDEYHLRTGDDSGLISKVRDMSIGDKEMKREVARFAASVCSAAERGDTASQNIVKAQAEDLADVTAGAIRRRFSRDELTAGIEVVRCGSVLGNTFFSSAFESQVERRLLSGSDAVAKVTWRQAATGQQAAVTLAKEVSVDASSILRIGLDYRPVVVHIS